MAYLVMATGYPIIEITMPQHHWDYGQNKSWQVVMAYIVMAIYSYGLDSYGLYSYGRCGHGLYSHGLYSYIAGLYCWPM